jgi:hypothetical protein
MNQGWSVPRLPGAQVGKETSRVSFHTRPAPKEIPWSREDEAKITELVRGCLRAADGSWQVTLTFSGVLARAWIVECQHMGTERFVRMLIDLSSPNDLTALRVALASLDAVADRASTSARAPTPAVPTARVKRSRDLGD